MSNLTEAASAGERPHWPMYPIGAFFVASLVIAIVGGLSGVKAQQVESMKESATIMEDTTSDSSTVDPTKKELPIASRELLKRPPIAWPTIGLLILAYVTYIGSMMGFITGQLEWWQSTCLSSIAVYWNFTVLHDAVHMAIAPRKKWLNELCGGLGGLVLFTPMSLFRFIHLSHHRYSGDEEMDPDAYTGRGPVILLPLRWLTITINYVFYFSKVMKMRSLSSIDESMKAKDRALQRGTILFFLCVNAAITAIYYSVPADKATAVFYCIFLPQQLAGMFLAYLFDYIPHRPHLVKYKDDPFQSTNATSLFGSVDAFFWDWAALGQQLHVVHHIWPFMPFYTYKTIWAEKGEEILAKGTRVAPLIILGSRADYFAELKPSSADPKKSN